MGRQFFGKNCRFADVLGLSADEVKKHAGNCKNIDGAITSCTQAQALAKEAVANKLSVIHDNTGALGTDIQGLIKRSKGYTPAIGKAPGVDSTIDSINPNTYKPDISAGVFPDHVAVKFTKKGVQGINIYSQLKGDSHRGKLVFDSYTPYIDNRPLHVANTPKCGSI